MILGFIAILAAATLSMMGQRVSGMLEQISGQISVSGGADSGLVQGEIMDKTGNGGGVGGSGRLQ